MKPHQFKDHSIDETANRFIEQFAINASSSAAKKFLDDFSKHIQSSAVSEAERSLAQSKLDALRQVYFIQFESSFRAMETGKEGLSPPSGLALTPDGNLVVSDDFNHRIQIYDMDHKLITQFGTKGKNPGELHYPRGIAIDPEGNIYVADSWNHRVQKFDRQGKYLFSFGSYGSELGQVNEPYDVHIDRLGNLIVVERYNHRVQTFRPDGASMGWIGTRGTLLEEKLAYLFETPANLLSSPVFEFPTSIASDSKDHFYIADSSNHRILKFNSEWKQLLSIGERGNGPGQFQYPQSVAVGPNDLLYISDLNNDRIQVFTSQGQFLFAFSDAAIPIKMPCLVLVNPQNRLYIGLTFNTQILSFDLPAGSEETIYNQQIFLRKNNFHNFFFQGVLHSESGNPEIAAKEYSKGTRILLEEQNLPADDLNMPILLCRSHDREPVDNKLLLRCLDLFDKQLQSIQQAILTAYKAWDVAATENVKKYILRDISLLEQKDESRVFDKEFYLAEKKDKTLFREIRLLFCDYKKISDSYAEYTRLLLQRLSTESDRKQCLENLRGRLERTCHQINSYLDAKEQNEETMIRIFSENSDNKGKWEEFRTKSTANNRIMSVIHHFHYELRTLLKTIKSATLAHPLDSCVRELLEGVFISPQNSTPLLRILLRNHERFYEVDTLLRDLMDTWIGRYPSPHPVVTLQTADIAPLTYDEEKLKTEDILQDMLIEGMPLKKTGDGLVCGDKTYRMAEGNRAEWVSLLETILKNQTSYEQKNAELYNQMDDLRQQRLNLDIQMRQIDARDKKAPIPIQKNIEIADFKIVLLTRMLKTLDINETSNIIRMLLCGALLACTQSEKDKALTQAVFTTIRNDRTNLDNKIKNLLIQRKAVSFEKGSTEKSLTQLDPNLNAGTLDQVLEMRKLTVNLQREIDRSEAALVRYFKIKNILSKLLDFIDEVGSPSLPKKEFLALQYTFGMGGPVTGKFFSPMGLAHTPEGNILMVDYACHQVCRFTAQGIYIDSFGSWGNFPGLFKFPSGVAVDSEGCIYVTDAHNLRVQKFSKEGNFILAIGTGGSPQERLGMSFSLSVDRQNNIWVVDSQNHRIQVYSAKGEYLRSIGQHGEKPENLSSPTGVLCLENGDVIVGDGSDYRLKRFDVQGKLIHALKDGRNVCDAVYFMASHPVHGIFAADSWMNRILQLDSELNIISVYPCGGRRGGQFGKLGGISIKGNTLVLANHDTYRIHVFELPDTK